MNFASFDPGDIDSGLLDGLVYSSPDDKSHVLVTTEALLNHWLRVHKERWGLTGTNVPQTIKDALKSEAFYTAAISTDARTHRRRPTAR